MANNSIASAADMDINLGQAVRNLILKEEIVEPVIFRKIHQNWEPCTWTLSVWGDVFNSEKMKMRFGKKTWEKKYPQWESECGKIDLTWRELLDWINGDFIFLHESGTPDDIWVYYDYKYLPDVFYTKSPDERDILKNKFCWSELGFPERNGDQTTLWIGTAGSYTPTHYDTYSCNLVCQVYGRKTWLLFPPKDTQHLHPTRIPYEESSVYSRINFASPKEIFNNLEDLKHCNALKVTLEPGDCLFIPPKWWHFVKSDDFSISVNTWIELPGDDVIRLEEAILRSVVTSVVNVVHPETALKLLNPNEMDLTGFSESDLNDLLLQTSTSACSRIADSNLYKPSTSKTINKEESFGFGNCVSADFTEGPPFKMMKVSQCLSFEDLLLTHSSVIERVPQHSFELLYGECNDGQIKNNINETVTEKFGDTANDSVELTEKQCASIYKGDKCDTEGPTYLDHLINAIGHPEVLKHISLQLMKNITSHTPPKY